MIKCPKCPVMYGYGPKGLQIQGGPCADLAGTRWAEEAEYQFCPTLGHLLESEITLPGLTHREQILQEMETVREGKGGET
jgi:hypothetical protein